MIGPTAATDALWAGYVSATGATDELTAIDTFGDGPELITELVGLVVEGRKRATAGLVRDHGGDGPPMPRPGDLWMVVDAEGEPVCILRTTDVRVGPLSSVDDDFAWEEGEGDRSRAGWLADHMRYFGRRAESEGWGLTEDEPCVFERFRVVWPPAIADPAGPRAIDLTERYVHLGPTGRGAEVPVGPDFWADLPHRTDIGNGRLAMVSRSDETWPHWERHPEGEELVVLMSGRADLVLELATGEHIVELEPGLAVLVPPGIWHRAIVHEPARMLTVTHGKGTEHRPHGSGAA